MPSGPPTRRPIDHSGRWSSGGSPRPQGAAHHIPSTDQRRRRAVRFPFGLGASVFFGGSVRAPVGCPFEPSAALGLGLGLATAVAVSSRAAAAFPAPCPQGRAGDATFT